MTTSVLNSTLTSQVPTPAQTQTSAPTTAAAGEAKTVISSDFETFLKMLTTQLEYQDPLDPVKSEDFAVQLATFSGVEQQVLTNDLLQSLVTQTDATRISQYADWVGMEARAPVAGYFDGSPITLSTSPEASAKSAVLVVEDAAGKVVQRVDIPVSGGRMQWTGELTDGRAAKGLYTFKVESISTGEAAKISTAEVYTKITETRIDNGKAVLIAAGGIQIDPETVTGLGQVI